VAKVFRLFGRIRLRKIALEKLHGRVVKASKQGS
jgi:hypothetical protein